MSKTGLRVVVDRYDIIITQPGSNFMAVYFKPPGQPYLVAKDPPIGSREFSERAWEMANAKARELRWIAGPPISQYAAAEAHPSWEIIPGRMGIRRFGREGPNTPQKLLEWFLKKGRH